MHNIDLHIHSIHSDGTCTIPEIIQLAKQCGLTTLAITDHDTMKGVKEAILEGTKEGIQVIPGMEISTNYKGNDIHILGYGMDPDDEKLKPVFEFVQNDRKERNQTILKKMQADGIEIQESDIQSKEIFGRPHFARILVEQGVATSISDAFERFLGQDQKYYVPRRYLDMHQAIDIIHACHGKAVLAHPFQYQFSKEELDSFLQDAIHMGIDGLETYYTGYTDSQIHFLKDYAQNYVLIVTCGSDFHGDNKPEIKLGKLKYK